MSFSGIGKRNYFLEVTMPNDKIQIPVIEIVGNKPGHTLILVAGLHGDEYEATQVVYQLNREIDFNNLSGRVIMVPIGNPLAYQAQSRTTPEIYDGKNLAREFPGNPNGSVTQRIADKIWKLIIDNCGASDLVIDLHSGGQNYSYVQTAGVREMLLDSKQTLQALKAARAMLIPQLCFMEAVPGTLSTVAIENGIPAIGCEVEGGGALKAQDVELYLRGIRNIMKFTGHDLEGNASEIDGNFHRIVTIFSQHSGYATVFYDRFSQVGPGDVICEVLDQFGEQVEEIVSAHVGQVWAIRTNPSICKGDIVALIKVSVN
ncbi:MAG: succinylglutamate desuccinylase/aspartoacylase family protein [Polynucleobacter sp.]|nr:succinylglutamate desuccinylase/aspartoacylase family protein [Polynucleobacter sp.]